MSELADFRLSAQHVKAAPSLASLTSRLAEGIGLASGGGDCGGRLALQGAARPTLKATLAAIDTARKGRITEQDLSSYALSQGLPVDYAPSFLRAVRRKEAAASAAAADASAAPPGEEGASSEAAAGVTYAAFKKFVSSREEALRAAFDLFDRDHDGRISHQDLDASLAHVTVCCPNTRCVYRTRSEVVSELLGRLDLAGSRQVAYPEFRHFFLLLPETEMLAEYWLSASGAGSACDMGSRVTVHERTRKGAPWGHLLAGAVAGAVSRTATAPLETLRLAAMAGTLPQALPLRAAAQRLVAEHGWRALYKGNLINVARSAPAKAIDFFAFDLYKAWLGDASAVRVFAAAGLAGATSMLALYPLDVVRSHMTLDVAGRFSSPAACAAALVAAHGPGALFRGLVPSVAAIVPEAAITYGLHDQLKRSYRSARGHEPPPLHSLALGVASAWSGQLVSYPLETVSRRMQLAGGSGGPAALRDVVAALLRDGGVGALYRGLGAATLRLLPMAVVSFGTYEAARAALVAWERQHDLALRTVRLSELQRMLQHAQRPQGGVRGDGDTGEGEGCGAEAAGGAAAGATHFLPVLPLMLSGVASVPARIAKR